MMGEGTPPPFPQKDQLGMRAQAPFVAFGLLGPGTGVACLCEGDGGGVHKRLNSLLASYFVLF